MKTKVSILIPIYKAEQYIEECLQSVFEQTYDNIEYILVDDASPDHSLDIVNQIIRKYKEKSQSVKVITNRKNLGIAQTRNILINNATGEYIYFVDSDDFIKKNTIEIFVTTALKEKADIVRCNYFNYVNETCNPIIREPCNNGEDMIANCLSAESSMNSLWILFIRRSIITDNDLKFPNNINSCEDYLMTIKLFYYASKIVDIPDLLYYYRLDNQASVTQRKSIFHTNACNAINEVILFLKEKHIYENNKEYCLRLMFTTKQHFLINKSIRNVDKYIKTFPESNSCYKYYHFNKRQKILFFLAEHKLKMIIKIISKLCR